MYIYLIKSCVLKNNNLCLGGTELIMILARLIPKRSEPPLTGRQGSMYARVGSTWLKPLQRHSQHGTVVGRIVLHPRLP